MQLVANNVRTFRVKMIEEKGFLIKGPKTHDRSPKTWAMLIASAMFIDSVLLSVVIPILPTYLSGPGHHVGQFAIGMLFASKAIVQIITGPFSGPVANRFGKQWTMLVGMCIIVVATMIFAVGKSYAVLFVARAAQGVGSSLVATAGLSLLAVLHADNEEAQGKAMGMATSGVGLGVIVGPPFGGVTYHFGNKALPFYILAGLATLNLVAQGIMLHREKIVENPRDDAEKPKSILTLMKDSSVWSVVYSLMIVTTGISFLEPTLPLWMEDKFGAPPWETGVIFLAASISYLLGIPVASCAKPEYREKLAFTGMISVAAGSLFVAWPGHRFATTQSIPGLIMVGFGLGICECTMLPMLAAAIDRRHPGSQASVFAMADMAASTAFALGPLVGSAMYQHEDFRYACLTQAAIIGLSSSLILFMKPNKTADEEGDDRLDIEYDLSRT